MQKYQIIKNNKGFTLVEVIVVAVIVLILAAVAIPMYMAYIKDSRQSTVEHTAATIAKTVGTAQALRGSGTVGDACRPVGVLGSSVGSVTCGDATNSVTVNWDPAKFNVTVNTNSVVVAHATVTDIVATVNF